MVVATSLTMTALVSLAGVISYASYTSINLDIAIPFVSAALIGSLVGKLISHKISTYLSKLTFGFISVSIALMMVFSLF
jgi:hypothetical protein